MKVAIVGENYYPTVGGIQEHIYHQAKYLRGAGLDVRVVTGMPKVASWAGPKDEDWVIRLGDSVRYGVMGTYTQATIGPSVFARMRRLFAEERFDLVHVHGPCDLGLPMLAYLLYRGPKVATLHSAFKPAAARLLAAPFYRWVLGHTDRVIAVSGLAAESMSRYARFDFTLVPNGVDVAWFAAGRRLAQFDDGRKNVVYLGRLEPRNGPDLLIAALPGIVQAFPSVRVIMGGDGPGGTEPFRNLVPEGLRDHVVFLGQVPNEMRPDLYASGDVFVLPARFGGSFSIMVLEALAAGAPVVSTPFVDERHRDSHWSPVHLTADYSPEAIAAGVVAVLGQDPAERVALGRRVVQEYDWARVGGRILDVYRSVPGLDMPAGTPPREVR